MRANLIYGSAAYLNGYTNISPFNLENAEALIGDTANLDWTIDNGELSELIALDTIEYLPHTKYNEVISNWVSKLEVGGKLILGFMELAEICNLYNRGLINHDQFNILVHGKQDKPHLIKLTNYTAPILIDSLTKQHTIKLLQHTLDGVDVTLTFERYK